jgi:hypothetical protein
MKKERKKKKRSFDYQKNYELKGKFFNPPLPKKKFDGIV